MLKILELPKLKEMGCKCGVFAVYGHPKTGLVIKDGLHAQQHRGQEGAGIVTCDGKEYYDHKDLGLVLPIFTNKVTEGLAGYFGIGHGRYSTQGANIKVNLQPHWATIIVRGKGEEKIWLAANGDLVNIDELRNFLQDKGTLYHLYSENDGEVLAKLVAYHFNECQDMGEAIQQVMNLATGAYSTVMLTLNKLFVFRDKKGFRPLALGRVDSGYVVASETCAFDSIEAKYLREVFPGEIICIDEKGLKVLSRPEETTAPYSHCIFEFIYFARPDSMVFGDHVSPIRKKLGRQLYIEHHPPENVDLVITVPDSSNSATLGYYYSLLEDRVKKWIIKNIDLINQYIKNPECAELPPIIEVFFDYGLVRSHYIQRTFIEPEQIIRDLEARLKYNPDRGVLHDKVIVVVDDSIVRGTTSRRLVRMLRYAGAKEVHYRVSSPPLKSPCYYGIDMPTKEEFIANGKSIEQIKAYLEVDSLGYLSLTGMLSCVTNPENFCTACFTGKYLTEIPAHKTKC